KKAGQQARLLDSIARLRSEIAPLRIAMQKDQSGQKSTEEWKAEFKSLESKIAKKIKKFASPAEAELYKTRGNIIRRPTNCPHQIYIDLCMHDLDHLKEFIKRHSPSVERDRA
ncbi:MAG: hypothetical protein K8F25_19535, partial [Fimbriimonadaceae bacterium]|nr:hypothetical protein [Alphaproteobacteria bacterium]